MTVERILVVDDEPDVEALVTRRFRREIRDGQIEFAFAGDGVEALAALERDERIGIVLCDINMPRMDGISMLERLQELDRTVVVVMVSAYGDMDNIRGAMNRGAFDFVTKPIDFQDLSITLDKSREHLSVLREGIELKSRFAAVEAELEVARRIQESILPATFPDVPGMDVHGLMLPVRAVGGDFFDVSPLADGRWLLTISDVSGKGIPGAIFMAVVHTMVRTLSLLEEDPAACMQRTNDLLCKNMDSGMITSLILATFDPGSGRLCYCNAGHPPPLLVRADGGVSAEERGHGVILGVMAGLEYERAEIDMAPGDAMLFYTDGVTEAFDPDRRQFSGAGLRETVGRLGAAQSRAMTRGVIDAVRRFAGDATQSDDITCLAVRRTR